MCNPMLMPVGTHCRRFEFQDEEEGTLIYFSFLNLTVAKKNKKKQKKNKKKPKNPTCHECTILIIFKFVV